MPHYDGPRRAPIPIGTAAHRHHRLIAGVVLGLHALLAWLARQSTILTGQDDAHYLLLGRALRAFSYRDLFQVDAPLHHQYPPGYPAALGLLGGVVGDNVSALVLISLAGSTLALLFAYAGIRRIATPTESLWCLGALALNPFVIWMSGTLRSEGLYAGLTLGALWWAARPDATARHHALAGAAAITAALTRTVGLAVVLALAVHWALERRWRRLGAFALVGLITVGGWLAWSLASKEHDVGSSYFVDFASDEVPATQLGPAAPPPATRAEVLLERIATNTRAYLLATIPYRLPLPTIPGTPVDNVVGSLFCFLGLVLGGVLLWRQWRPAALYLALYAGVLAVWPWHGGRFIVPLIPLLVPGVVLGYGALAGRIGGPRWRERTVAAVALLLALTGAARTIPDLRRGLACQPTDGWPGPGCLDQRQASFFAALAFVRDSTPPDAVIHTMKPETAFYFTERRGISRWSVPGQRAEGVLGFLRAAGVSYLVVGSLQAAEFEVMPRLLAANCRRLELAASFPPWTQVLRVLPDSVEPIRPDLACHALAVQKAAMAADPDVPRTVDQ